MLWEEVDLQARLWVIPAERMKAGREHRIPLSESARGFVAASRNRCSGWHRFWFSQCADPGLFRI